MKELNEYFFSDVNDQKRIEDMFLKFFKQQNFVPFLGSGFTRGEKALKGKVPSVEELSKKLIELMIKSKKYSDEEILELRECELSKLSDFFWMALEGSNDKINNDFLEFVKNKFTKVDSLPTCKKELLESKWRYIYTLNYDDAIEKAISSTPKMPVVSIPFDKISNVKSKKYLRIYKIHGDAQKFFATGDKKYFILSLTQYLTMIDDTDNIYLKNNIATDFASNNLIFIGCSLVNELDLILSAQTGLSEKKKLNGETKCIYVKYVSEKEKQLTNIQKKEMILRGVTDIIYVAANDMCDFYKLIKFASDSVERPKNEFDTFTNYHFKQLKETNIGENIKCLFMNKVYLPNNKVQIPSFFIRREVTINVIKDINQNNGNLFVIRGSHFSGKTYVLLDILKEYCNFSTLYFKSGTIIKDELFLKLIEKKNTLAIFDENTLSFSQIFMCRENSSLEIMKKNNTKFVIAINCSIGIFTKHFYEDHPSLEKYINIYSLNPELKSNEIQSFNTKIGKLGLSDFKLGDTLLDYALRIDNQSIKHNFLEKMPAYDVFSKINDISTFQTKKILKLFIILLNQSTITVSETIKMDLSDIVFSYCHGKNFPFFGIIQKEVLLEEEKGDGIHDSFRVINNSRYWIYRCLFNFADNPQNYDIIAQVYYEIVLVLINQIQTSDIKQKRRSLYNKIKPYYFLDTIQQTFFKNGFTQKSGSLSLSEKIYKKLMPLLNDNYQFMHQKAKCLLRKSRLFKNSKVNNASNLKKNCLNAALQQINRAIELASTSNAKNIQHTVFHMKVTKVLILVNEWRYCTSTIDDTSKITQLLIEYKNMLDDYTYYSNDIYDREFDDQELKDVRWFVTDLLSNIELKKQLNASDKKLVNDIINESNKKIFRNKQL